MHYFKQFTNRLRCFLTICGNSIEIEKANPYNYNCNTELKNTESEDVKITIFTHKEDIPHYEKLLQSLPKEMSPIEYTVYDDYDDFISGFPDEDSQAVIVARRAVFRRLQFPILFVGRDCWWCWSVLCF